MNTTATMTGPQHYREAERLLKLANPQVVYGYRHDYEIARADTRAAKLTQQAQVHATLALAWASMSSPERREIEHREVAG